MHYRRKPKLTLPNSGDILRQTLPNGITLLARENFASPTVVVNGYLQAGSEDEPPEKLGLAGFTTDVMERGTRNRSFSQLYEEVESVAASFGVNAGTHTTSFGAKGLAENLPTLLDILNDVIRNPVFDTEQVEKARAEILTDIQERDNDTRRVATLLFQQLAYPENHPYHRSSLGYPETIAPITRDDLTEFHSRHFAPQGMVITVVGAIKAADAAKALSDVFGDWQASRPVRPTLPDVPKLTGRHEKRTAIPDKTQSNVILGWPGPARLDPDFIACFVTNTILGVFGLYGRLGHSVREANGLAYYVYSHASGGAGPGPWRITAGVNPANVDRAVALIQDELRRIRDERVPKDELSNSTAYLTGSLPLQLETNEGVARSLINIERYNLGLDYLEGYTEMITGVTEDQVQAVAQRWLDPDNFALAIVEPA